ncbi:MAG: peptidoglycan-associated lipoprotein Pal [Desulfonauticus sp.]|nr:peptidoglycan-associated lipoprotein Pal [Desulfonauticus sp.]
MRTRWIFGTILMLTLVMGCAKKKIETYPAGVSSNQQIGAQTKPYVTNHQEEQTLSSVQEQQGQTVEEQNLQEEKLKQAQQEKEDIRKIIAKRIFFDFDSYELKPEARKILQQKAEILKKHPEIKIVIEGHCDERGTEEYNLALGEKRARAAYEFLILLGVDANRMQIVSYGEEDPLDPRHCEAAWAKNRRDEFKIISSK